MSDNEPPDIGSLEAPEGCVALVTPFGTDEGSSFVEGDPEGSRLRLRMFMREDDKRVISKIWWGPDAEGPPGHAHGGSMAAVLDHTMGVACWVAEYPVVAASITVDFLRGLPLKGLYSVEAWVERVEGKKVYAAGRIFLDDFEAPYATGTGLFIQKTWEEFMSLSDESGDESTLYGSVEKFFEGKSNRNT